MNIFILDSDPVISVQYLTDGDLNLMINELFRVLNDVVDLKAYGTKDFVSWAKDDPWVAYAAAGRENFEYLMQLCALANMELGYRFNRSNDLALAAIMLPQPDLPEISLQTPPVSVETSRRLYIQYGGAMPWTKRPIPEWMTAIFTGDRKSAVINT